MKQVDAEDLTQAVIARLSDCKDPRFKQVMTSLIEHIHAFAQDVQLRPDEWMTAIQFLTATGQKCDEKRQEFILLSDTLGLSMRVVAIDQARGASASHGQSASTFQLRPQCKAPSFARTRQNCRSVPIWPRDWLANPPIFTAR